MCACAAVSLWLRLRDLGAGRVGGDREGHTEPNVCLTPPERSRRWPRWVGPGRAICASCGRTSAEARALESCSLHARRPLPGSRCPRSETGGTPQQLRPHWVHALPMRGCLRKRNAAQTAWIGTQRCRDCAVLHLRCWTAPLRSARKSTRRCRGRRSRQRRHGAAAGGGREERVVAGTGQKNTLVAYCTTLLIRHASSPRGGRTAGVHGTGNTDMASASKRAATLDK